MENQNPQSAHNNITSISGGTADANSTQAQAVNNDSHPTTSTPSAAPQHTEEKHETSNPVAESTNKVEIKPEPSVIPTMQPSASPIRPQPTTAPAEKSSVEQLLANMQNEHTPKISHEKSKIIALGLIGLGILFVVGAAVFFLMRNQEQNTNANLQSQANPTPTPTATMTPTPAPTPSESDPVINNLNNGMNSNSVSEPENDNVDKSMDQIQDDFEGFGPAL